MLGETGVASPEFHLDAVAWVRACVQTKVGARVLDQAVAHKVETLSAYRRVTRPHVDEHAVPGVTALNDRT